MGLRPRVRTIRHYPDCILGIDPGTKESGWVLLSLPNCVILEHGIDLNEAMADRVFGPLFQTSDCVAIEMISSYGKPVGREVFETCVWIGRFIGMAKGAQVERRTRQEVARHFFPKSRGVGDKEIRQAIIDRLGPQGTKAAPGPTYGLSRHTWSAAAVAMVVAHTLYLKSIPQEGL